MAVTGNVTTSSTITLKGNITVSTTIYTMPWGKITGDIDNQADLKAKFEEVNTSIENEADRASGIEEALNTKINTTNQAITTENERAVKRENAIEEEIPDVSGFATKLELSELDNDKVDKVDGKSLSTNDYTNEDKSKLDNIEEKATRNVFTETQLDAINSGISNVILNNIEKNILNKVDKKDGYSLMSADEHTKLDGIEEGANKTVFTDAQLEALNSGITNTTLNAIEKNVLDNAKAIKTETTRASDVEDSIKEDVSKCSLITETGNKVDLEIDTKTYELVAKLYDKNNNLISTSTKIDLPLETLILNVEYDKDKKALIITLKDGTTKEVPVGDLVSGLVSETTFNEEVERAKKAESDLDTNKVDKVTGKGLSTNDFTDELKTKVDNMYTKDDVDKIIQAVVDKFTPPAGYQYLIVKNTEVNK